MGVILERYSAEVLPALAQGIAVARFVGDERRWLTDNRSDTADRYRDTPHAIYNVVHLAKADAKFHPFIVRDKESRRRVYGVATLITGQTIRHPKLGERSGTDMDYILRPGSLDEVHEDTARALLRKSGELALKGAPQYTPLELGADFEKRTERRTTSRQFAVVPTAERNQLRGFELLAGVEEWGGPAKLLPPLGFEDTYDVAKTGATVQVYAVDRPVVG